MGDGAEIAPYLRVRSHTPLKTKLAAKSALIDSDVLKDSITSHQRKAESDAVF